VQVNKFSALEDVKNPVNT